MCHGKWDINACNVINLCYTLTIISMFAIMIHVLYRTFLFRNFPWNYLGILMRFKSYCVTCLTFGMHCKFSLQLSNNKYAPFLAKIFEMFIFVYIVTNQNIRTEMLLKLWLATNNTINWISFKNKTFKCIV